MHIQISQKELLKHINIAQKAISSRTTVQILEGILFIAKDNQLKLISTDLELSIETIADCVVEEEGEIVIHSNIIGNIVRKLPNSMVDIKIKNEKINIKCENSEFNLMGQDALDYPQLPEKNGEAEITLDAETMKQAIRQTVFAASLDETRPALTGVLFRLEDSLLDFVALDGFRISLRKIKNETSAIVNEIIPARALQELQKIIIEDNIRIQFVPGNVIFYLDSTIVYSRLLEGKFINYKDIMETDPTTKLVINRVDFQNSLERASLLAREEKANLVKLNIEDQTLYISSNSDIGSVNESIQCKQEGDDLEIAFNAKYLLEGLKAMESEECELLMTGSLNPCIFHPVSEDEDYTYLVLPVRLARD